MLRTLRTPRALLLVALFIVSVATLVRAIVGTDNTMYYTIATVLSHIALVIVGSTYAKGSLVKKHKIDNT